MSRRAWLLLALFALLATGAAGWWLMTRARLPAFDLQDADPEVRRAILQARRDVEGSPRSGQAWGRLGMVLLAHGFRDDAAGCFSKAEYLDPTEPRWPAFHAQAMPGDPDSAIGHLRRAADRADATNILPSVRLAELLLEQGQVEEAADACKVALQTEPNNVRARLVQARICLRTNRPEEGLQLLEALAKDSTCKKAALHRLAQWHGRRGSADLARSAEEQALALPDDPPAPEPYAEELSRLIVGKQTRLKQIKQLGDQGRTQEALALSRQIEKDYPDIYWLVEARIQRQRGNGDAAIQAYHKTIELDGGSIEARFELAELLSKAERWKEALFEVGHLLNREPSHGPGRHLLGWCWWRLGERSQAEPALRRAVAIMPRNATARRDLGEFLLEGGMTQAALGQLQVALELAPDDAKTKALIAQTRARPGKEER